MCICVPGNTALWSKKSVWLCCADDFRVRRSLSGCHATIGQASQQPFALIADLLHLALLGTSEPPP